MKKKILSVLLSFIMILVLSVNVSSLMTDLPVPTDSLNRLLNSFRSAIKNGDNYLSLKEYDLYDDSDDIMYYGLYELLSYNTNDIGSFKFGKYNESYIDISLVTESDYITGVNLYYDSVYVDENGKLDTEKLNADKKLVSERYREALSVVKKGMTDIEKALALYDHLLTITDYPGSIGSHGADVYPDESYKAYGLLRDGFSTCMAYAKLYAILLNESGVPAVTVGSDTIDHEWVMVCIDGEWYHCDPTWDDFVTSYGLTTYFDPNEDDYDPGALSHEFFMKSDEEIIELDHPDWDVSFNLNPDMMLTSPESGPSGKFDDKFFSYNNPDYNCCSAMSFINGSWYFCDTKSNSVVRTTLDGEPEYLAVPEESEYIHYSFPYGNDLYVATDYSVYRMDTVSDRFEKIFAVKPNGDENEDTFTVFSEMGMKYDEMTLTTVHFTYADDDSDELFSNVTYDTQTYPMSDVQYMTAVDSTDSEIFTAQRDSSESNSISEPKSDYSAYSDIIAENIEGSPIHNTDPQADTIRSSSLVYIIVAAVVLTIAAGAVIAALIINKRR